jgi:DNA-binding beta-propeller fold protein YncE
LDGMGTAAQFNGPESVAVDVDGNLFVADKHNHSVRKIAPDATVITLAGCNERGSADGPGAVARFELPSSVAVDGGGNIIVLEECNSCLITISPNGLVTTLDIHKSRAFFSQGLAIDADGNVVIADGASSVKRFVARLVPFDGVPTRSMGLTIFVCLQTQRMQM